MSARAVPAQSPPLGLVAPFLLAGPVFLAAAGVLVATSKQEALAGINVPHTLAATHALVLGWLTTTMMGVLYQMGPVVIGGELWSQRLARAQCGLHVVAVGTFVVALERWDTAVMAAAGSGVALSLALFVVNAAAALIRAKKWSLARFAVTLSFAFLVATATLGLTYALAVHNAWFPITMGRLSAHAHLGLLGWLALTLMGLSYQLVPMFNIASNRHVTRGYVILAATGAAIAAFAAVIAFDPPAAVRLLLAVLVAAGPAAWAIDLALLLRSRSKASIDIQGRATFVSLAFLGAAIAVSLGAALGTPLTPDTEPARWLLAYGALGMLGWMGTALAGNSFKVLPFLLWYHRYRPLVGKAPVPVVSDIYSERAAIGVLGALGATAAVAAVAALAGNLLLLRAAGVLLTGTGVAHLAGMLHMFLPKQSSRAHQGTRKAVTS